MKRIALITGIILGLLPAAALAYPQSCYAPLVPGAQQCTDNTGRIRNLTWTSAATANATLPSPTPVAYTADPYYTTATVGASQNGYTVISSGYGSATVEGPDGSMYLCSNTAQGWQCQ